MFWHGSTGLFWKWNKAKRNVLINVTLVYYSGPSRLTDFGGKLSEFEVSPGRSDNGSV